MYFDDCKQPGELQRAISEFMKIQTGRRVSLAGKRSVSVPLINEHTDQTLREGVAEAYAVARKIRNNYPALSDVPTPSVVPLESLGRLSEWCERAMREMPEKPAETEQRKRTETPSEDKSIEQIAKKAALVAQKLEDCLMTDHVTDRVPARLGHYQRAIKLVEWFFATDLVTLQWYKPDVADWVQEKYKKLFKDIKAVDQAIAKSRTMLRASSRLEYLRKDIASLANGLQDVAKMAREESAAKKPSEKIHKTIIVAIIVSFIVDLVFILLVYFVPFTWVKNHPNSYGLQGSFVFLIPCLIVGLFKPQYRKWCWGVAGLAFLVLVLSLLGGGPTENNIN